MAWYNFRKSAPQQKNAYSLDSPALLDMMLRADKPGLNAVSSEAAMRLSTVYSCIKVLNQGSIRASSLGLRMATGI